MIVMGKKRKKKINERKSFYLKFKGKISYSYFRDITNSLNRYFHADKNVFGIKVVCVDAEFISDLYYIEFKAVVWSRMMDRWKVRIGDLLPQPYRFVGSNYDTILSFQGQEALG